jgi:hypothetical protein
MDSFACIISVPRSRLRACCLLLCIALLLDLLSTSAHADAALLLAEPYGRPGGFNPVAHAGHAGIYLTRVCASTPTVLRRCRAGETGVVVSRYDSIGDLDWVAIPLMGYLYAAERAADVPTSITSDVVHALRDGYRRAHLRALVPDTSPGELPGMRWTQLIGAAYDRRIIAFSIRTTPEQDDALIAELNGRENRRRFNIFVRNCADFARDLIGWYHPGAVRRNIVADMGFTTPKHIAKALVRHAIRRPETGLSAYLIPQIPGNRRESWRARGVLESLLQTKKYMVPLAVVQTWVPIGLATGYVARGQFDPHRYATRALAPADIERGELAAVDEHALAYPE